MEQNKKNIQKDQELTKEELEVVTGGKRERRSHHRKVQDPTIK